MPESRPAKFQSNVTFVWLLVALAVGVLLLYLLPATQQDRIVAIRTIALGLSASVIALPLGGLIVWVCRSSGFISKMTLFSVFALLLVPMFIHVSSWDALFGKLGWLTATKGEALKPLVSGWNAASWIHGIAAAPQVAVIFLIGLGSGKRVFEEQALLDAAPSQVFWHVTFRRLCPLAILSVVWIVISCAREIGVTDLYQIGTLSEQIYLGYSLGLNSIPGTWTPEQLAEAGSMGPWLAITITAWLSFTALILFIHFTSLEFRSSDILPSQFSETLTPKGLNILRQFAGGLLLLILVVVPSANVITRACFYVRPVDGVPTQGYSIEQLFRAVQKSVADYQNEFIWSFLIALTSATIILLLSICFATVARRSRTGQWILAATLAITCAIPGPMIGTMIGSLFADNQNEFVRWLYNYTITAPVMANFLFCWPVGALLTWFLFRKIPEDAIESSNLDGAGQGTQVWQFGIAANITSLIGCFLVTFAVCFGELSASQIVRPAGMDTVSRKMLGDLHAGVNELTAGITIVTALTIVAISLLGWSFIWLNRARGRRQ
jgi:ABC-type Fe3+ transport system permease subunit